MNSINNPMSPVVSVLMCAHNEADLIEKSICSVLNERSIDIELVVVNDRSTDDTGNILKSLASNDSRLKIITRVKSIDQEDLEAGRCYAKDHGHGGQTDALNLGLRFCVGDYIARLDADDICLPDRLQKQLAFMEENREISFLGSSALRINHSGKVFGKYHSRPLMHNEIVDKIRNFEAYSPHSSWFVKRELYERLDGYDQFGYRAEDLDFMLRATEIPEVRFAFIDQPLVYLRMHGGSLSYTVSSRPAEYAICAVVRHFLRKEGFEDVDGVRVDIMARVKKMMQKAKIDRKIASYDALRTSFISFRGGRYITAIINMGKSIFFSPKVALNYKVLSFEKNRITRDVFKSFLNSAR